MADMKQNYSKEIAYTKECKLLAEILNNNDLCRQTMGGVFM